MSARPSLRRLLQAEDGIAITELALTMPVFLLVMLAGTEIANYMTVRMRVSQLALHIADNAARIGEGSQLAAKTISEAQINDLLKGADLQSGGLELQTQARVILSSLQGDPANPGKYKIAWQRCLGDLEHEPVYGEEGDDNLTGMGPSSDEVTAMPDTATMFVELRYKYRRLVPTDAVDFGEFTEIAAMTVRDRRDLVGGNNGVHNVENVTPSTCN